MLRERESKARKTLAFSCFCGERHDDDDSRAFLLLNAACPRVAPQPRPLYFLPLPLCVFHSRTHSFLEYTPHTGTDEDDRDGGRRLKITFLASQTIISLCLPPSPPSLHCATHHNARTTAAASPRTPPSPSPLLLHCCQRRLFLSRGASLPPQQQHHQQQQQQRQQGHCTSSSCCLNETPPPFTCSRHCWS